MSYTYFFDIFMSYTYGFWVIYVLYLSRAAPLSMGGGGGRAFLTSEEGLHIPLPNQIFAKYGGRIQQTSNLGVTPPIRKVYLTHLN